MINVDEIKKKILETIKNEGPRLPVQVAKAVQLSPVFTSAILSELVSEKKVKMSNLKYGSSSLYILPGEEQRLEEFVEENMGGAEKYAYNLLKNQKVLEDLKQEPAIRVALRSIKDFATPINFDDKLFWKYNFVSQEEVTNILERKIQGRPIQEEKPIINEEKIVPVKEETAQSSMKETEEQEIKDVPKKKKKEKVSQDVLLNEVKNFLAKKNVDFVREIEFNNKEVTAVVNVKSEFGIISWLMIVKDKKKLNVGDINMAYQKALGLKMPCYLIFRGEPSKSTIEYINEHRNLLKVDSF
jgi:hypothetical protein